MIGVTVIVVGSSDLLQGFPPSLDDRARLAARGNQGKSDEKVNAVFILKGRHLDKKRTADFYGS